MSALRIGFVAWAALVLLQPAWYLWLAPPANGRGWLALVMTLPPLLLPLIALRANPRRALLWAGIVAMFYFCHGVVAAWAVADARAPAIAEALLCLAVIAAAGKRGHRLPRRA
jgi:uncharacterized membrane protein